MQRARPAMLMLTDLPQRRHDGSAASTGLASSGSGAAGSHSADGSSGGTAWQQRRLFLQAAVVHAHAEGVQVAFMSELRSPEGHLFGFRTGWRSSARGNG